MHTKKCCHPVEVSRVGESNTSLEASYPETGIWAKHMPMAKLLINYPYCHCYTLGLALTLLKGTQQEELIQVSGR